MWFGFLIHFIHGRPPTYLYIIYFIWWVTGYILLSLPINKAIYRKVTGLKREQIKYKSNPPNKIDDI